MIDKRPIFYQIFHPKITSELRIPAWFFRHISEESPDKATLNCLSGGTWNIKLQCDEDGLLIHRLGEISEKLPTRRRGFSQHETQRERAALEKAEDLLTPNIPQFVKCLEGYNVNKSCFLNIPADFVREYMPKTSELIELQDSNGNKWNVRCIRRKSHMFLSKGWLEFVRDNSLVVGDACVFELIKDLQADELMLKTIGKNCIIQFDASKHTGFSDAFGPVSSNRTSRKTDMKKSFTESVVHGRPYNRRKRG
ncbi:hypothetical protein K7X08_036958 [Anisodus acutangulus]|uniref:TF-B3 domain-containing protein n=1 Tax=Anisodus acutangulus TaxID=402998 RepID=A0A9Q1L6B3_9SOLA|nr:hypothetical protein K7X08_036958 [Anisodus acutangulus]